METLEQARSALVLLVLTCACGADRPDLQHVDALASAAGDIADQRARPEGWASAMRSARRSAMGLKSVRGRDDRLDLYQLDSPQCQVTAKQAIRAAARASMAIFEENDLEEGSSPDTYTIKPRFLPLSRYKEPGGNEWCKDEVFVTQARGAVCSGVLIAGAAGPRILSARHCLGADRAFVFGFAMTDAESPASFTFSAKDVCRARPGAQVEVFGELAVLDIACEGAATVTPARLAERPLVCSPPCLPEESPEVYAIGYPQYLPAKFSGWGRVLSTPAGAQYFSADLDLAGGNSGSPVFNAQHEVVGIVNDDGNDAGHEDRRAGCRRWKVCPRYCNDLPKIYFVTSQSISPSRSERNQR